MAFWNRKAAPAVEEKSLADPDPDLLQLFTGVTSTGVAVSAGQALTVPAVSAAVRVISEAAATLNVRAMRGSEEISHPAAELLRGDANDWSTGFEIIRDITAQALTYDDGGLAWVNRAGGKPIEIIRYDPAIISVEYANTGEPEYRIEGRITDSADIVHVRSPFGRCPLTLARNAIGVAYVMEQHAAKLFQSGARPGGIIESPKAVGDAGVRKMISAWRAAHDGPDNAGKTAVLWDGTTFKPLSLSSVDAQFLELRKFQIDEIARAFRVPPSMVYSLDRATWNNATQMGREFLVYCLEPWLRALEGAFSRALLTPEERKTMRISFDRDDLTRADIGERATAYSSLISARVMSPNEIRKWEDLPPYTGGDEYANPAVTPGAANSNKQPAKGEAA